MSIISDWTEQARAESALRETEARFRQLAENIDELVFITDASLQQVQYVNPRLEALVGIDETTLAQAPARVLEVVHPQALAGLRRQDGQGARRACAACAAPSSTCASCIRSRASACSPCA